MDPVIGHAKKECVTRLQGFYMPYHKYVEVLVMIVNYFPVKYVPSFKNHLYIKISSQ